MNFSPCLSVTVSVDFLHSDWFSCSALFLKMTRKMFFFFLQSHDCFVLCTLRVSVVSAVVDPRAEAKYTPGRRSHGSWVSPVMCLFIPYTWFHTYCSSDFYNTSHHSWVFKMTERLKGVELMKYGEPGVLVVIICPQARQSAFSFMHWLRQINQNKDTQTL